LESPILVKPLRGTWSPIEAERVVKVLVQHIAGEKVVMFFGWKASFGELHVAVAEAVAR